MERLNPISHLLEDGHIQYPAVKTIKETTRIIIAMQNAFFTKKGDRDRLSFRDEMMKVFDLAKRGSYPHLLALAEIGLKAVELGIKGAERLQSREDLVSHNLAVNMPHRLLLLTETAVGTYLFLRNARHIFDTQVGGKSAEIFTRALRHDDSESVDSYHPNKVGGFGIVGLNENIRGILIAGLDNISERIQNPHGKVLLGSVLTNLHQRIKK